MSVKPLRLGTRGSTLARTQSEWVAQYFPEQKFEFTIIKTAGDDLSLSLFSPGEPGAFVNALRTALLAGEVDLLVHSMKDLPSAPQPQLTFAAIPKREDARDVLVSRNNVSLSQLPDGSVIGTSSPRRMASIKQMNPALNPQPIRGNIDTRIQKVRSGEYDAVVLAAAGLARINKSQDIAEFFSVEQMVPAPAQGALAIECRSEDAELIELLSIIDHAPTRLTSIAERAVLQGLQAGCEVPIGAFAKIEGSQLVLIVELGGSEVQKSKKIVESTTISSVSDFSAAQALGLRVAQILMK